MVIDSAGSSDAPEEQPVQRQLSDGAGDDGQRGFDCDDDRTADDDVVNMAWCDDRLSATTANLAATIVGVAFAWSALYLIFVKDLTDVPGGSVFSIFILYVTGAVVGWLINRIVGIPSQYGMLLAGFALQNAGLYTVTGWCLNLVSLIRFISFVLMFIKGGLELDAIQLRRLSGVVAKLTFLPCIAEAATSAIVAHLILPGFSWQWSLALGLTLSAVSPDILVSGLFQLKRLGYGEVAVNTLLIAASSLNNIVSICAFRIVIGNIFMTGSMASKIIQGFVDVSIGTTMGVVWGFFLIFVPPSPWTMICKKPKTENTIALQRLNRLITAKRSFLLGTGGFIAMAGGYQYGYPEAAGPLACIISAFVASTGWRWRLKMQDDRNNPTISVDENCDDEDDQDLQGKPVEKVFEYVWDGLQPFVLAFLGTDIKFELLKGFDMVLVGLLVVTFGIAVRMIFTTCSVLGTGFSRKEIIFVNISWLPKSTTQAIIASIVFDFAKNLGTAEDVECGNRLVTIAVISIFLTAPIGAIGIKLFGPKLLPRAN